ncbi:hypothetical protein Tco_0276874, partial [Tanacetum coccineum]
MHTCTCHHQIGVDSLSKLVMRVLLSLVPEGGPYSIDIHDGMLPLESEELEVLEQPDLFLEQLTHRKQQNNQEKANIHLFAQASHIFTIILGITESPEYMKKGDIWFFAVNELVWCFVKSTVNDEAVLSVARIANRFTDNNNVPQEKINIVLATSTNVRFLRSTTSFDEVFMTETRWKVLITSGALSFDLRKSSTSHEANWRSRGHFMEIDGVK